MILVNLLNLKIKWFDFGSITYHKMYLQKSKKYNYLLNEKHYKEDHSFIIPQKRKKEHIKE